MVANSLAGLAGNFFGHCTSPTLRSLSGGMDIVMSVILSSSPRSPENRMPGLSEGSRVVATSISTCAPFAVAAVAVGISTPCGRPAQPERLAASRNGRRRPGPKGRFVTPFFMVLIQRDLMGMSIAQHTDPRTGRLQKSAGVAGYRRGMKTGLPRADAPCQFGLRKIRLHSGMDESFINRNSAYEAFDRLGQNK